jgi:hypothetical protein
VKLTERYLGPRRRFTGYCDRCGMLYTVYWSYRQTIQHQLSLRRDTASSLRRQPARQRPKTMAETGGGTASRAGDQPGRRGGQPCPVAGCADPGCLQRRRRQPAGGATG